MKKILIFSDPQADFQSYMIHHGLTRLYGGKNVITYPFKKSHHGLIDDTYILDDGKTGFTTPGQHMISLEGLPYSSEDIKSLISNHMIEYAILQSPRTYSINAAKEFQKLLEQYEVPLVYIDGEDGTNIRWDVIDQFNIQQHFKRELLKDKPLHQDGVTIYPLPFSSTMDLETYPDREEKDIDVFFGVGLTNMRRRFLVDWLLNSKRLKEYNLCVYTDKDAPKVGFKEYTQRLSRAKINIICRGHGWDTVRRFEACDYSGLVLSDRLPIKTPNDFLEGQHIVHYNDDLSDLVGKIIFYLKNDKIRKEIGEAGKRYAHIYHSSLTRAKWMDCLIKGASIDYFNQWIVKTYER